MSADHVVLDERLSEDEVPFGRSRLLKFIGAGLFGYATQAILRNDPAWATHTIPGPCVGLDASWERCPSCSGSQCTASTCGYYHWEQCPTGGQCWTSCYSNCTWRCCDWMYTSGSTWKHCICGTCIAGTSC